MGEPASGSRPHHPPSQALFAHTAGARRVAVALVGVPVLYSLIWYLPPWAFFACIGATCVLAQRELTGMFIEPQRRTQHVAAGVLGAVPLLIAMQWPAVLDMPPALLLALTALLGCHLGMAPAARRPPSVFMLLFGLLYIVYTLGHLLPLRNMPDGARLVCFVLLVTWAGDAAAYYTGAWWGSRPMAPRLSPQKTVEGLLGGLAAAPAAAWVGQRWLLPSGTPLECLLLGALLTLLGVLGDLSESALKRSAGVKDSGALLPGHGGVLDRIDSLLLNVPAFYYYMKFVKGIDT